MTHMNFMQNGFLKRAVIIAVLLFTFVVIGTISYGQEEVTIKFAVHWDAPFQPVQAAFDEAFMERHPEITVEIIYNTWADHNSIVPTWAAAGELPDIVYVHGSRATPWAAEGICGNLDAYIDATPDFDVEGIFPVALEMYQYEGSQYMIPYDHGVVLLGYNKDAFDAAGLAYPDETWTMDDLAEAARELTIPGQQWGFGGYYNGISLTNEGGVAFLGPWGAASFNDTEDALLFDTPEAREALEFWYGLMAEGVIPNAEDVAALSGNQSMYTGQAAMFGMPSWETPGMTDFATFAWDVAPWPEGPKGRVTGAFGSGFCVTTQAQQPDAAWLYLSEYLSTEGMEFMWGSSGRGSPAREAAYQSWLDSEYAPENAQYYLDALANYAINGRPFQSVTGPEVIDVITQNQSLLNTGEITVDEFIANVLEQAAPIFNRE
jgi:multiple sugar transport system substrate-binding protein